MRQLNAPGRKRIGEGEDEEKQGTGVGEGARIGEQGSGGAEDRGGGEGDPRRHREEGQKALFSMVHLIIRIG